MTIQSSFHKVTPFLIAALLATTANLVQAAPDNDARYIIQFKPGKAASGKALAISAGAKIARDLKNHQAMAAYLPQNALNALQRNPNIEFIETDPKRYPSATQYEPNATYGISMVQADQVTEVTSGPEKMVCIIDSGIDLSHPEFATQGTITGTSDSGTGDWFTDENSHGTHVAGTIAALANGEGVYGVNRAGALNVHIIKVFDANGWAYSSDLVAALDACENAGADVISMSLGGSFKSRTEDRAFAAAASRGVLPIAAAGNDGNTRKSYPASYDSVVSVAAIDANKVVADFSQKNSQVELAAPGVSVLSSVPVGTGTETLVQVGGVDYEAFAMEGSAQTTGSGPLVDCGTAETVCAAAASVCLIQRGNISFADKVLNCQNGGGVAAIIYNNVAGSFSGTLGDVVTTIPSVSVSDTDGAQMQPGAAASVSVGAGNYAFFDGTSMATPHVSGVAALIWNNAPGCSAAEVRAAMDQTAEDLGAAGRDDAYGFGLVQAQSALALLNGNFCGGGGSNQCTLGQPGDACSTGSDCCSNSCKGKPGAKTCR